MATINLVKVTKVDPQWNNLAGLKVKFNPKSTWYELIGVEGRFFVLKQRNGETFRTNQIFVRG